MREISIGRLSARHRNCAAESEQDGSMFVADRDGAYRELLCVQEER
jgi:hypothetical protein